MSNFKIELKEGAITGTAEVLDLVKHLVEILYVPKEEIENHFNKEAASVTEDESFIDHYKRTAKEFWKNRNRFEMYVNMGDGSMKKVVLTISDMKPDKKLIGCKASWDKTEDSK